MYQAGGKVHDLIGSRICNRPNISSYKQKLKRCKLYLSSLMEINILRVDYKYTMEATQMLLTRCRKVLILHLVPIVSFLGQGMKASPRACGRNQ